MWWQDKRTGESASFFFLFYPFFSLCCHFLTLSFSFYLDTSSFEFSFFFCCLTAEYLVVFVFFCLPRFFFSPGWRCLISIFPSFFLFRQGAFSVFCFLLLSFVKHHSVQLQNLNRHFRIRSFNDTFFLPSLLVFFFFFCTSKSRKECGAVHIPKPCYFPFLCLFFSFLSFLLCVF